MTPTVDELQNPNRFTPLWLLPHDQIAASLAPFIWKRSVVSACYIASNLAAMGIVAWTWLRSGQSLAAAFSNLCVGMTAGYVCLLPIHENAHALVYRLLGARTVRVHYLWRTLTAYCAADMFVVDRRGMVWVCLAPFLLLNPVLAAAAAATPGGAGILLSGALLMHVGACSGDFGFFNWLHLCGHDQVYNYDDVMGGRSYFFVPNSVV